MTKRNRTNFLKLTIIIFLAIVLFISLVIYITFSQERRINQTSNQRVVVFVLDAGDWRIVNPLLKEGKLKNIAYLINNGVSGESQSVYPLYTSPNMASLFSGKPPSKHGIKSHFEVDDGKTINALFKNMQVKPIWKLLKGTGVTMDIVGWQEFDKAPKIDGTVVTGLYLIKKVAEHNNYFSESNHTFKYLRYIPDLILTSKNNGEIMSDYRFLDNSKDIMIKNNLSLKFDTLLTNITVPYTLGRLKFNEKRKTGVIDAKKYSKFIDGVETIAHSNISAKFLFEYDMLSKEISLDLYKRHKSNILFIYLTGTDLYGHNYYFDGWQIEDKNNEQRQVYKYYEVIDCYIGEFLSVADENTTFFVTSDHGIQNLTIAKYLYAVPHPPAHSEKGIFIATGKGIKKNFKIVNESIMDLTPTLLYMYDQPIADDFDGKILLNIFDEKHMENKTIKRIPTYEEKSQPMQEKSEPVQEVSIEYTDDAYDEE